jgi:glutaredoxin
MKEFPAGKSVWVALGLFILASCSFFSAPFKNAVLATADGSKQVRLSDCATGRCVTVYVAPWCPHCRDSTLVVKEVQDFLKWRGIDMRVVVGMDKYAALKSYAQEFGPDALLDPNRRVHFRGGVPHIFLSGPDGTIYRDRGGLPAQKEAIIAWVMQ